MKDQREKKKVSLTYKKGYSIYKNDNLNVNIFNNDGLLEFQINDNYTYDAFEFVLLLKELDISDNDPIWNIKLKKNKYYICPSNTIYLLTGGKEKWKSDYYLYTWEDVSSFYEYHFSEEIIYLSENSNCLLDIKNSIEKKLSILRLYEFSIRNNILI